VFDYSYSGPFLYHMIPLAPRDIPQLLSPHISFGTAASAPTKSRATSSLTVCFACIPSEPSRERLHGGKVLFDLQIWSLCPGRVRFSDLYRSSSCRSSSSFPYHLHIASCWLPKLSLSLSQLPW
jgi:hypothetical protein